MIWPLPCFMRRVAWHLLDHAWEIEDRIVEVTGFNKVEHLWGRRLRDRGFGCFGLGSVMYRKREIKHEENLCLLLLERQDR